MNTASLGAPFVLSDDIFHFVYRHKIRDLSYNTAVTGVISNVYYEYKLLP